MNIFPIAKILPRNYFARTTRGMILCDGAVLAHSQVALRGDVRWNASEQLFEWSLI
jgi:hypothetical protein